MRRVGVLVFTAFLLALVTASRADSDARFIPTEYKVKLRVLLEEGPNAKKITSDGLPIPGSVTIRGHPSQNTSIIKLDIKELEIKSVNVSRLARAGDVESNIEWARHPIGVRPIPLSGEKPAAEKELLTIETEEELRTGEYYEVGVEYVAKCQKYPLTGSGLIGVLEAGTQNTMSRWLLWTKLGRRDASRVFPCVNDPAIRAKMELEVVHRPGYTVVSHQRPSKSGEAKWEAADNNETIIHHTTFPKTVPLPLYSFGVVIGALERRTYDFGPHHQALNIYWPKHETTDEDPEFKQELKVEQTSEHIKEMIDFLQGQLGSDNVTNLELVMVDDFNRNTGTYHGLIISPITNILKRGDLTEEQWFLKLTDNMGSLLPRLWLGGTGQVMYMNDAISRFLYYGMLQAVGFTDWKVDSIMLRDMRRIAFTLKSAVSFEDAEVAQSGKLALEEKAALMRLLEDVLTAHSTGDKLRLTFRQYASIYWEREPTLGDFAEALEQAMATTIPPHSNGSHEVEGGGGGGPAGWNKEDMVAPSLRAVLDFWLKQTGYPLVQVENLAGNSTNLAISQVPYKQEALNSSLWPIPVSIVTADSPTWKAGFHHLWLQTSGTPLLKQHDSSKWVLLNYNVTAFYRTLYKGVYLENIKAQLVADLHKIPPLSRGQLWDDYFNFVERGHVDYPTLLNLTAYLDTEDSPAVWSHFLTHFKKLVPRFSSHPRFSLFKSYFQRKLDGGLKSAGINVALDALSFDGSDSLLPQESLFNWACRLGASSCESYAKGLLAKFQADPEVELAPANSSKNAICDILCAVTAATKDMFVVTGGGGGGNESGFGSAALAARGCPITAPACAVDPGVIRGLLAEVLGKNGTEHEEMLVVMVVIDQVIKNPQGRPLLLDWLSENFKAVSKKIGGVDYIADRVRGAAEYWSTQEQLTKFEQFVARHKTDFEGGAGATASLNQARELIRKNMEWMSKDGNVILEWLEAHQ